MVARSRMPPPSCTGISSPTASTIERIAASLTGLPANAPLRSTRCRRRAPCSFQWRAVAAGSSENTVALSISPCSRRTQWPSLRSIAGIINMANQQGRTGEKLGAGCAGHITGGIARTRIPGYKVAQQRQSGILAFFRMELHGKNVLGRHRARERKGVMRAAGNHLGRGRLHEIAVDEIEAFALFDPHPQRVRHRLMDVVPAHVVTPKWLFISRLFWFTFGVVIGFYPEKFKETL